MDISVGKSHKIFGNKKYLHYICITKQKYNTMTRFASNVYDFVESVFGTDAAIKNYCFWCNAEALLMYMGYLFTLPVKFIKMVWRNLKEKGVI